MQWARSIAGIAFCLLLLSCTSIKISQELQAGKMSFAAGDFKKAFHQLLPLAAEANPQAEYAVGYMYYNGYGVSQDRESGLFWMQKSADQRYTPAIKALEAIHAADTNDIKEEIKQEPPAMTSSKNEEEGYLDIKLSPAKNEKDAVLQTLKNKLNMPVTEEVL